MVFSKKDKMPLLNRSCYKKMSKKSEIKEMLEERKKYVIPDHIVTLEENRQYEMKMLTRTKDKLERKRKEAEEKHKNLEEQWQNLTMKELEFKRVIEDFNISTIEIRQKMEREKVKIHNMRKSNLARKRAIKKIKQQIADYTFSISEMRKEAQKLIKYEDFLIQFAERYEYKVIGDILQRYTLLFNTREEVLVKMARTNCKGLEYKAEYNKLVHRCDVESVWLLEALSQQTYKYDKVKDKVHYWERIVYGIKYHMQRLWNEINTTKAAMDHVVCLLAVRLRPKVPPEITCGKENLKKLFATKSGNLAYVNKKLGDLEEIRKKLVQLFEEKKQTTSTFRPRRLSKLRKLASVWKIKSPQTSSIASQSPSTLLETSDRFPKISYATAKTLEDLRNALFSSKKWDRAKRKFVKPYSVDSDSFGYSVRGSVATCKSNERPSSYSSRRSSRMMSNWEFLKEVGDMTDEELIRSVAHLQTTDRKHEEVTLETREYTCTSLMTDPLDKMQIDKEINSRSRRIVERNFDRYERKFKNPLRRDSSSILKINKETGKLELPKLKYPKNQMPPEIMEYLIEKESRSSKLESGLPRITRTESKIPRRINVSALYSAPGKNAKTKKPHSPTPHKKINTFAELTEFLNIPAISSRCHTDYL